LGKECSKVDEKLCLSSKFEKKKKVLLQNSKKLSEEPKKLPEKRKNIQAVKEYLEKKVDENLISLQIYKVG